MDSIDANSPASNQAKPPGLLLKLAVAGFLFFIWFITFFPWIRYQFWQSDTWWLIETGRLILNTHALPTHDPYSFTSVASHWTVYQWLTEVLFGMAHAWDGLAGVALFGGMLMGILLFVLIFRRLLRTGANPIVAVAAVIFCAYSYFPDFSSLRPQLISFLLFWLMLEIVADVKTGLAPWKALTKTFVIAVIWANCHISFPVALLMLTANIVGTAIQFLGKQCDKKLPLLFAAMLTVFYAGTFITPFGPQLWLFISGTHNLFYSEEVANLKWNEQPFLATMAVISFLSAVSLRKKLDTGDKLTWTALIVLGSDIIRMIAYFCIFSCPIIAAGVTQLVNGPFSKGALGRFGEALKAVAMSRLYLPAMVLFIAFVVLCQPTRIPSNIPIGAAQYLVGHPIAGHMFCSAHAGSYLIYTSRGTIPVFIDTRIDLYDAKFCAQFIRTLYQGEKWKEIFSQYKIAAALIPNGLALRQILEQQPDWHCAYRDHYFSLFVPGPSEQAH